MKKSTLIRLLSVVAFAISTACMAQTYPVTSPVYQPNAQLAAQSQTATGTTTPFTVQGIGVVTLHVSGTATSIAGTVQVTNDVIGGTQTWTVATLYPLPGQNLAPSRAFSVAGVYKINVSGMTQVRVNLTTINAGTVITRFVGGQAPNTQNAEAIDLGALSTFASQAAATVTSADQTNVLNRGVICSFLQSSTTGAPSTTFSIQSKDGASGAYTSLLTSAAITSGASTTAPTVLAMFPGASNTATSANMQLPATWRLTTTVGGSSTPIVSGTIGCQTLP